MAGQEIKCKVDTCKYHKNSNICSLHDILVGETKANPDMKSETECSSFEQLQ